MKPECELMNRGTPAPLPVVCRVARSWPGGPKTGTIIANMPAARRKQLLAGGFLVSAEGEPQAAPLDMPIKRGPGRPKKRIG